MSKLLIEEHPLQVLPSLAELIGLNEAIFLQQLHYWLKKSEHHHDGRVWIYNTVEEWREQFPFWSAKTISRIVNSLRKAELITTTDQYNQHGFDKKLWYSIDYKQVDNLIPSSDQVDQSIRTDCPYEDDNLSISYITETTTETTTTESVAPAMPLPAESPAPAPVQAKKEKKPAKDEKPTSEHKAIIEAYLEELGNWEINLTFHGEMAKAAQRIVSAGFTPEQVRYAINILKTDPFWDGKHLPLTTIGNQLSAIIAKRDRHSPGRVNPDSAMMRMKDLS